jgi:hypothetical protein
VRAGSLYLIPKKLPEKALILRLSGVFNMIQLVWRLDGIIIPPDISAADPGRS